MRYLLLLAFVYSPLSLASYAEFSPDFYSSMKEDHPQFNEKYRWLYELIMPEGTRKASPKASERSFEVHLKDSRKYFPHPQEIITNKLSSKLPYLATGKITYSGVFPARYKYDLSFTENEQLLIEVRVHFRPEREDQWPMIQEKIAQAEVMWNASKQNFDFDYAFKFSAVRDKSKSHFSVNLKRGGTRGPYFQNWSTRWSANTVAHELGHMMGLGDEYRTVSGKMDCIKESLMCSSSRGSITYQHHYHILRRALAEWKKQLL